MAETRQTQSSVIDYVVNFMVRQKATMPSQGIWGVLAGLAGAGKPCTFAEVYDWMTKEAGADVSAVSARDAFQSLTERGFISKSGEEDKGNRPGPRRGLYVITSKGLAALECAPHLPIGSRAKEDGR